MLVNRKDKIISYKIVYYGAALSGKTTNLRYVAGLAKDVVEHKTEMLSLETKGSRTLYFDTLQLRFGQIGGYAAQFNLYTTPGQMTYITKRRLVLTGADAIIFVMDSQLSRQRDNVQSWFSMERQLFELGMSKTKIPILVQLNKRDMHYVASHEQLLKSIRGENLKHMDAVADKGTGVMESLKWVLDELIRTTISNLYQDTDRTRATG